MVDEYSPHSSVGFPRFKFWFPARLTLGLALPRSPLLSLPLSCFLGSRPQINYWLVLWSCGNPGWAPSLTISVELWHPCPSGHPEKTIVPGDLLSLSLPGVKPPSSRSLCCLFSPSHVRMAFVNLAILFQNRPQVRQKSTA